MSFQDHLNEDLRLCLLRLLDEAPGSTANSSILHDLVVRMGHSVPREQVVQQLGYLATLQAVTTEQLGPVLVAGLRTNGQNHLKRLGPPLPGVKLPSLG